MKAKEMKTKSDGELAELLNSRREVVREFRWKSVRGKTKNVRESRAARKDIARVLTEQRHREKSKQ